MTEAKSYALSEESMWYIHQLLSEQGAYEVECVVKHTGKLRDLWNADSFDRDAFIREAGAVANAAKRAERAACVAKNFNEAYPVKGGEEIDL